MILCCQEIVSVVQVLSTWSSTVCANNDKDERKQR